MAGTMRNKCRRCGGALEAVEHSSLLTCVRCGEAYDRQPLEEEATSFADVAESEVEAATGIIETRLAEIEELLQETHSELDSLRARELSAPLQLGCAFFGIFSAMLAVIAIFMLLGKSYFGSWIFFVCLAVVGSLGIARIRRKLVNRVPAEVIGQERDQLERALVELEDEAEHLRALRARLLGPPPGKQGQNPFLTRQ